MEKTNEGSFRRPMVQRFVGNRFVPCRNRDVLKCLRAGVVVYVKTPVARWKLVGFEQVSISLHRQPEGTGDWHLQRRGEGSTPQGVTNLLHHVVNHDFSEIDAAPTEPVVVTCSKQGRTKLIALGVEFARELVEDSRPTRDDVSSW